MRWIDQMTPNEIDVLKLKGMLPDTNMSTENEQPKTESAAVAKPAETYPMPVDGGIVNVPVAPVAPKPKRVKPKSRPQRWASAAADAAQALSELVDIQSEYESWRDALPDNLRSSAVGEKLDAVCDLDLQSALDAAQEAENADLPRGFGKD